MVDRRDRDLYWGNSRWLEKKGENYVVNDLDKVLTGIFEIRNSVPVQVGKNRVGEDLIKPNTSPLVPVEHLHVRDHYRCLLRARSEH